MRLEHRKLTAANMNEPRHPAVESMQGLVQDNFERELAELKRKHGRF